MFSQAWSPLHSRSRGWVLLRALASVVMSSRLLVQSEVSELLRTCRSRERILGAQEQLLEEERQFLIEDETVLAHERQRLTEMANSIAAEKEDLKLLSKELETGAWKFEEREMKQMEYSHRHRLLQERVDEHNLDLEKVQMDAMAKVQRSEHVALLSKQIAVLRRIDEEDRRKLARLQSVGANASPESYAQSERSPIIVRDRSAAQTAGVETLSPSPLDFAAGDGDWNAIVGRAAQVLSRVQTKAVQRKNVQNLSAQLQAPVSLGDLRHPDGESNTNTRHPPAATTEDVTLPPAEQTVELVPQRAPLRGSLASLRRRISDETSLLQEEMDVEARMLSGLSKELHFLYPQGDVPHSELALRHSVATSELGDGAPEQEGGDPLALSLSSEQLTEMRGRLRRRHKAWAMERKVLESEVRGPTGASDWAQKSGTGASYFNEVSTSFRSELPTLRDLDRLVIVSENAGGSGFENSGSLRLNSLLPTPSPYYDMPVLAFRSTSLFLTPRDLAREHFVALPASFSRTFFDRGQNSGNPSATYRAGTVSNAAVLSLSPGARVSARIRRLRKDWERTDNLEGVFESQLEQERALRERTRDESRSRAADRVEAEMLFLRLAAVGNAPTARTVIGDSGSKARLEDVSARIVTLPDEQSDDSIEDGACEADEEVVSGVREEVRERENALAKDFVRVQTTVEVPGGSQERVSVSRILSVREWEREERSKLDGDANAYVDHLVERHEGGVVEFRESRREEQRGRELAQAEEEAFVAALDPVDRARYLEEQTDTNEVLLEECNLALRARNDDVDALFDISAHAEERAGASAVEAMLQRRRTALRRREWLQRQQILLKLSQGPTTLNDSQSGRSLPPLPHEKHEFAADYNYSLAQPDAGKLLYMPENARPPEVARPLPTPPAHVPPFTCPLKSSSTGRTVKESPMVPPVPKRVPKTPDWRRNVLQERHAEQSDTGARQRSSKLRKGGSLPAKENRGRSLRRDASASVEVVTVDNGHSRGSQSCKLAVHATFCEKDKDQRMAPLRWKKKRKDRDAVLCMRHNHARILMVEIGQEESAVQLVQGVSEVWVSVDDGEEHALQVVKRVVQANGLFNSVAALWPEGLDESLGWRDACAAGERRMVSVKLMCDVGVRQSNVELHLVYPCKVYARSSALQGSVEASLSGRSAYVDMVRKDGTHCFEVGLAEGKAVSIRLLRGGD